MRLFSNHVLITLAAFLLCFRASAQIREITFGDIPEEDLAMTEYTDDPSADAVILENYARVSVRTGERILVDIDCHIRIKILNTDGLDYANVELPFGNREKLTAIKAASYNIEDGKTVTSEVDRKSIFYDRSSRYRNNVRFSIPNVRTGSVIEYKYSIESPDYFSLYTLDFQQDVPVRKCSFNVEFPGFFEYKFVPSGDLRNVRSTRSETNVIFGNSIVKGFSGRWTAFNMPAYREEPFSTGSEDYYARLGFELSKIDIPGYYFEDVSPTYPKLSTKLLEHVDFGGYLTNASVVKTKTDEIKAEGGSDTDILRRIYTYITNYMIWNGYDDYTSSAGMSRILTNARGNAADINLMLIAMLRQAGIPADPVILSTRENGLLNTFFAVLQRFNYVVAYVRADGEQYLVDATDPLRPFNMLPFQCLNGQGWIVNKSAGQWINLRNEERSRESMQFKMELSDDGSLKGTADNSYESYDAWAVRKVCKLEGTEAYTDLMRSVYSSWKIHNIELNNLENLENPVTEKINLSVPFASETGEGIMYLNPAIWNHDNSNEFYADERLSPVDLGCPESNKYSCEITIPEGWVVSEMPQSVNLAMEGGGGEFRYIITTEGRKIMLETEIKYTTVTFPPERYNALRNFRSNIIRKQSEVVVLRKNI
jgi:transglutaminase-like putative cysteine protease